MSTPETLTPEQFNQALAYGLLDPNGKPSAITIKMCRLNGDTDFMAAIRRSLAQANTPLTITV